MAKLKCWEDREGVRALEPEWRRLEAEVGSSIFQTWDWADCRLAHHSATSPFVVTAEENNAVGAIFPFCRANHWYGFPMRRLRFIGTGPADYGGWLCAGPQRPVLDAVAKVLAERQFDVIDLHQLPEAEARAVGRALEGRYEVLLLPQEPTLTVDTGTNFEAYLTRLSKKFRKNTTYADRRLRREFDYTEQLCPNEHEIDGAMDNFFDLHQQRWLSKRLPGLFLGGGNRRFHKELARRLARDDRLVLGLSYINGEPAAAFYGFKFGRDYSYYLGGFEPKWSKYSVSSVLIHSLIKGACDAGFENFDFLRGREPYKLKWSAKEMPLFRVVAHNSGPRGRLGAALAKTENTLAQKARARLHSN